jgi:hypothetical protein|tara:strand:+ start:1084 stop:1374 length:291 start_codon:yes stop_codon:yes gene_type:complete
MKVNKDTETGIVTYTMPNGKSFSAPYKNAAYCVACDGDEVPSTWNGKTYIYMYNWQDRQHDYYCFEDDISSYCAPWEVMGVRHVGDPIYATAMREI